MTVAIHLSAPYAPMLTMLASAIGGLAGISPAAVKQYGKDFSRHGGGTGPFKFKLWESGQRFVLEANKDYWGGAPKLDGLVFRPIIDENARVSEMLSGGTDITIEVPPDNIANFTHPREIHLLRAAGAASLVPFAQHQGKAFRRQARSPGRELRDQQGRHGQRDPERTATVAAGADAGGLHLGA